MPNTCYVNYAEGTPLFYMVDTYGSKLSETNTDLKSRFKTIVDKSFEQGIVYQSEPIGAKFNLSDRFTDSEMGGRFGS